MPLLDIRHLTIEIETPTGRVKAVERMSLTLHEGEIRGLVGESGSGKSLVAKAIIGVCKDNWKVTADRMRLGNIDLLQLTPKERRRVIARDIAMIFQEPSTCLDPSVTIGKQLIESIPARNFKGKWWQRFMWREKQAIALLHKVGIKKHKQLMNSYAYELTDGECQKVMIAMAIATKPKLLIADEPTNDLDVETLRALEEALLEFPGCAMVISHDRWFLDRIATHIIDYRDEGQVNFYEGNYNEYMEWLKKTLGSEAAEPHRIKYKRVSK